MNIGERIKNLRTEKGLTQKELSISSSISEISIRKYENGDRQPKQKAIYSIAKALDVSEAWLMGYDVPMERTEENMMLAQQINQFSSFVKYLESIGYIVRFEEEPLEWHEEEMIQDGMTVGKSKVVDEATYSATLTKGKVTTAYTEKEFESFVATVEKSIEFEIFKKSTQEE